MFLDEAGHGVGLGLIVAAAVVCLQGVAHFRCYVRGVEAWCGLEEKGGMLKGEGGKG